MIAFLFIFQEMERKIDATRQKYTPMSSRGAVLFFTVADLANIDSMYQHSLTWFFAPYNRTIATTAHIEEKLRACVR